jgi:predicted secreted protein
LQDQGTLAAWTIALPNSVGEWAFNAYVTDLAFDVDFEKAVTFSGKLTCSGAVVYTPAV